MSSIRDKYFIFPCLCQEPNGLRQRCSRAWMYGGLITAGLPQAILQRHLTFSQAFFMATRGSRKAMNTIERRQSPLLQYHTASMKANCVAGLPELVWFPRDGTDPSVSAAVTLFRASSDSAAAEAGQWVWEPVNADETGPVPTPAACPDFLDTCPESQSGCSILNHRRSFGSSCIW